MVPDNLKITYGEREDKKKENDLLERDKLP